MYDAVPSTPRSSDPHATDPQRRPSCTAQTTRVNREQEERRAAATRPTAKPTPSAWQISITVGAGTPWPTRQPPGVLLWSPTSTWPGYGLAVSIATAAVLALAGPAFAGLDDGIVPDGTNAALEAQRRGPTVNSSLFIGSPFSPLLG